ncbi:uncharacterized protein FIBRA_01656 [Fibroporia radiculosa]|uniref:BZIP domain-containing protein n=1 Tax=Fibroporia radiculosa TaxID=599839 RepID=J4I8L8_9APHY|nr:uncharacterized protein FIBRA_01656 [Fibroporia radiculosa]CCL99636.1 predicted protein [Fibroporia radiculosa]
MAAGRRPSGLAHPTALSALSSQSPSVLLSLPSPSSFAPSPSSPPSPPSPPNGPSLSLRTLTPPQPSQTLISTPDAIAAASLKIMDPFGGVQQYWDLSQQPNAFSALPDDDFLAFLEKQFPTSVGNVNINMGGFDGVPDVVDPQTLTRIPIPNPTPPSSDSSPSPPSMNNDRSPSRRQSGVFSGSTSTTADGEELGLKRKASSESIGDEPTHKSQHTSGSVGAANANGNKKVTSSRRKSTGNPSQDETRLLKRKEQNRAAQRAFRERKEKHVKDLEDKVAALEAKNQMTESENENLRDLLSRLQNENMMLKQAAFTFSVPRDNAPNLANGSPASSSFSSSFNFASPGAGPSRSPLSPPQPHPALNFNSLIAFDPNSLNMADEPSTADNAMNVEYGFGQPHQYKTIAANPMFMSFAEPSPYDSPAASAHSNSHSQGSNYFNSFDMSPFDQWSPPESNGLDQLFGGNFLGNQNGVDFNALLKSPPSSISPVSHASFRSPSSSSPSSSADATPGSNEHENCPKTKEELAKHIVTQGASSFASCEMPITPFLRKAVADETGGAMIMCKGSSFPPTEKSDKNVEVLTAWRSITSNPQFKDLDINELCSEFTSKARCDGTKVVLEPQGVHHIIETLAAKRQQQAKQ